MTKPMGRRKLSKLLNGLYENIIWEGKGSQLGSNLSDAVFIDAQIAANLIHKPYFNNDSREIEIRLRDIGNVKPFYDNVFFEYSIPDFGFQRIAGWKIGLHFLGVQKEDFDSDLFANRTDAKSYLSACDSVLIMSCHFSETKSCKNSKIITIVTFSFLDGEGGILGIMYTPFKNGKPVLDPFSQNVDSTLLFFLDVGLKMLGMINSNPSILVDCEPDERANLFTGKYYIPFDNRKTLRLVEGEE